MAMMWALLLPCGFLCSCSQLIYPKENNRCARYGETIMEIRELLIQRERIKDSLDSLRQMVKRLEEDVNKSHKDVQIVKKGNYIIRHLTKGRTSSLYVSIILKNGRTLYELYHQFSVFNESDNYRLFLGGPATGKMGDSMLNPGIPGTDLPGMPFSTRDRDNDRNIAALSNTRGGWWFNSCRQAFLNGLWSAEPWVWSNPWRSTVRDSISIKRRS